MNPTHSNNESKNTLKISKINTSNTRPVGLRLTFWILKLRMLEEAYDANVTFYCYWEDEPKEDDDQYPELTLLTREPSWVPTFTFYNTESTAEDMTPPSYYRKRNYYKADIDKKCSIIKIFDLHRFPFDRQIIKLEMSNKGFQIVEVGDIRPSFDVPKQTSGLFVLYEHDDFIVSSPSVSMKEHTITIEVQMTRNPQFYLYNIVLVNFFIVLMSFSVVGISYTDYGTRLPIIITSVLTAVAFKFATVSWVPIVNYLTYLDKYIVTTFGLLTFLVFESFMVSLFDVQTKAESFENTLLSLAFIFWIFLHLGILLGAMTGVFYESWDMIGKKSGSERQRLKSQTLIPKTDGTNKV